MSDQRPEWMPDDAALLSMEYHGEEALRLGSHRNTHDAMRAFAYRTGLRAQIAALEEAAKLCESYNPCHEVFADHFKDKIAALRKELENG